MTFLPEPLSAQMLVAADIVERFNTCYADIYTRDAGWRPSELRREAKHRRDEEAAGFTATCPECGCTKDSPTERARELWIKYHAHERADDE